VLPRRPRLREFDIAVLERDAGAADVGLQHEPGGGRRLIHELQARAADGEHLDVLRLEVACHFQLARGRVCREERNASQERCREQQDLHHLHGRER
jgi:hypothetical protein